MAAYISNQSNCEYIDSEEVWKFNNKGLKNMFLFLLFFNEVRYGSPWNEEGCIPDELGNACLQSFLSTRCNYENYGMHTISQKDIDYISEELIEYGGEDYFEKMGCTA